MPDDTQINKPTVGGGQFIASEVIGQTNFPRGKMVTGDHGVDGGDVKPGNPLDVRHGDAAGHLMPAGDDPTRAIVVAISDALGAILGTSTHPMVVTMTGSTDGLALDATLTSGVQKTQIVDSSDANLGTVANPLITADGPLPSFISSLGAAHTGTVKSTSGRVMAVQADSRDNAELYIQIYAQAPGAPSGTPVLQFKLPPQGYLFADAGFFTNKGLAVATGIVWAASTTPGTFTAATDANVDVQVVFT